QELERQNGVLATRWRFLQEQEDSGGGSDGGSEVRALYERFRSRLAREMAELRQRRDGLERDLQRGLATMDACRAKYEDEIRLCSGMEFTFMELKK
ncbi:K2C80 protein, partial [Grallaria varia]|nr:K2C80 protein [Grallaria varia]